jgi:hypothetical protein
MPSRKFRYYDDDWRGEVVTCPGCGWSGTAADMNPGLYKELTDYSCPTCDQMLLVVGHPTRDEVERAASRGVEEAIQQLELIRRAEQERGGD